MGMSASQARLLSITARLSDNEASAQAVSFAKQRLADETQQINEAYNKALMKTKISAITGYNDAGAVMEDISYALLTDERVRTGKQYIITDVKGRVLVDNSIAKAFRKSNGDVNIFLAEMGYTQAANNITRANATLEQQAAIEQEIENAWDKYYASVGIKFPDEEHDYSRDALTFGYVVNGGYGYAQVNVTSDIKVPNYTFDPNTGLATVDDANDLHSVVQNEVKYNALMDTVLIGQPSDFSDVPGKYYFNSANNHYYEFCHDGGTQNVNEYTRVYNASEGFIENGRYYRYTDEISTGVTASNYAPNGTWEHTRTIASRLPINYEGASPEQRELYDYAVALTKSYFVGANYDTVSTAQPSTLELKSTADDPANKANINYYKNLFYKMQLSGCYSYTNTGAGDENTIRVDDLAKTVMKDSALLQEKIKSGELYLEFFSASEKKFVSTTLGQDDTITEVEDESAIAKAEVKYEQDLTALEQRDKKFDLQLKKLDTEHNTLQTEYDCIKQIISKNVQNSFKTFNG